ncbi:MAG: putative ABC transporter permease subunit, partial [Candidatus Acidiferrum sp.]
DPQQWAQVVIFSGLMLLYVANTRRLFPDKIGWVHQNVISLLNFSTISLLLCTYTGRFVFPLLSLEGRKFWILGLLPLQRDHLLLGKFAFSATMALGIAAALVLISDFMIGMPIGIILLHLLTVTVLSAGLSGLSVGLGAWMPNFRETDPSKIAVGFGGTLNLVISLFFLISVVALMVLPWHVYNGIVAGRAMVEGVTLQPVDYSPRTVAMIAAGILAGMAIGGAAVVIPMRMGIRSLRRMEF